MRTTTFILKRLFIWALPIALVAALIFAATAAGSPSRVAGGENVVLDTYTGSMQID